MALYRAKQMGRNRFEFFTRQLHEHMVSQKQLADEILQAMERDEFVPYYQLQFATDTLEVAGVETLVRWQHPTRGLLGPDVFLGMAEELAIVAEIDRLILEKALADCLKWQEGGFSVPKCSVNVSARRLADPNLRKTLANLPPRMGRLSFELLESIFLDQLDKQIAENIDHIRAMDIDLEIDDFGTGHASVMSLMRLSPKVLKIDRALIATINRCDRQRRLVGSIIEMGHALDTHVLAEGVETAEHIAVLHELKCDFLQGYGLARPMPAHQVVEFVRAEGWRKT